MSLPASCATAFNIYRRFAYDRQNHRRRHRRWTNWENPCFEHRILHARSPSKNYRRCESYAGNRSMGKKSWHTACHQQCRRHLRRSGNIGSSNLFFYRHSCRLHNQGSSVRQEHLLRKTGRSECREGQEGTCRGQGSRRAPSNRLQSSIRPQFCARPQAYR